MGEILRLLIAEDSVDDTLLLVRHLRSAGITLSYEQVASETSMRMALDRQRWDLVIADYSMPGFGGVAALRLTRGLDPEVPFIFVSGTMGEDVAVEALRAGAQDYVMKGNLRRLLPAIERELREANIRRERRRTEEALRSAEYRLQQLLASSTAVLYAIEVSGEGFAPTWVSENITSLFGYSVEEAIQPLWWVQHMHPADLEAALAELSQLADRTGLSLEYRFRHKDGGYRWIHDQSRLFPGTDPGRKELVGAWIDVTERRRLEEQFRQAQKMEAVGRLAGGIAHDFNNLLSIITSHSGMLEEDLGPADARQEDAKAISHAAMEAAGLTRQLLAFSRRQVLEPIILSLNRVVTDAERMLARLLGEDVELVTVPDPSLGSVKADPGQMTQVLMNLAVNARDAMPEGGKLTIETANAEMDQTYATGHPPAKSGRYVMLSVTDTGTGMDEEAKAHLFEPFFTTKEAGKGTGLGLATVYGIVKQSEGFVWVYSEVGKGSAFRIYLPRVDQLAPAPVVSISPPEAGGSETILLVEDAVEVRTAARRILERKGYTLLEATEGEAALRLAAAHQGTIHLLLTDVVMPGLSGRELAERLQAIRPGLGVLFVSGYTADAVIRHGVLEAGVAYLQKPFNPAGLAQKVRQTLDLSRSRDTPPPKREE